MNAMNTLSYLIPVMIICFSFDLVTASSTSSLPTYSYSLSNPNEDINCGTYLVLRLYDIFDQESFILPNINIEFSDGSTEYNFTFPYILKYNYSDPTTYYGQITYGEDQYASYYFCDLTQISNTSRSVVGIFVEGELPRVNYMNMKYEYETVMNGQCPHKSKVEPS